MPPGMRWAKDKLCMNEPISQMKATRHDVAGKSLAFTLHHESYAINVLKVREIIRHANLTPVPQ